LREVLIQELPTTMGYSKLEATEKDTAESLMRRNEEANSKLSQH